MQSQQFGHPGPQFMLAQPHMLPYRPGQHSDYRDQHMGQPQQLEGRHPGFLAQEFPSLEAWPQAETMPVHRWVPHDVDTQLQFDTTALSNGLLDSTQALENISNSARHHRVSAMQRMLQAPCSGCLQTFNADEAWTHRQIYCIHLPSTVRMRVMLDYEQWKDMCASGMEIENGETYPGVGRSDRAERNMPLLAKKEEQTEGRLSPVYTSPEEHQSSFLLPPVRLQEPVGSQTATQAEASKQENSSRESIVPEPQHGLPTQGVTVVGRVAKPDDAAHPIQTDSNAAFGNSLDSWAVDSIRELLELKGAAEPGTPLEVALALQQALRDCLLQDVTEGNSQDGEPSAIGLLRVLDPMVEDLQARPADG